MKLTKRNLLNVSGKGITRRTGNMASMSGADDDIYLGDKIRIKGYFLRGCHM